MKQARNLKSMGICREADRNAFSEAMEKLELEAGSLLATIYFSSLQKPGVSTVGILVSGLVSKLESKIAFQKVVHPGTLSIPGKQLLKYLCRCNACENVGRAFEVVFHHMK